LTIKGFIPWYICPAEGLENAFGGKSKIKDAEVDLIVTTCTISILSLNTGREKYLLHPKSFFFQKKEYYSLIDNWAACKSGACHC
jgi:hypothetical protein